MEKLMFIFIVPFLLGEKFTLPTTSEFNYLPIISSFSIKGGVITMEDVLLHVTLYDPIDRIEEIVIQSHNSGFSIEEWGCGDSSCTYDLDYLQKGFYDVKVTTRDGSSFEQIVYLN